MPARGRHDHARGAVHAPLRTAGAAGGAIAPRRDRDRRDPYARSTRRGWRRRSRRRGRGGRPASASATPTTRSGCSATCSRGGPGRPTSGSCGRGSASRSGCRTWVQTPVGDRGRVATPHDRWGARPATGISRRSPAPAGCARRPPTCWRSSRTRPRRGRGARDAPGARGRRPRIGLGWWILPEGTRSRAGVAGRGALPRGRRRRLPDVRRVAPATGASAVVLANQVRSVTRLGWQVMRQVV